MRATTQLPAGYREIYAVDLQKDKKTALWVNLISLAVMAVMIALANHFLSISTLFDFSDGAGVYFLRMGIVLMGMVVYVILHELTHGAVMKHYGAKKLRFGFTGLYAYCGSEEDFFSKKAYIQVALAPLVVWGVILTILCALVPKSWFWVLYLIQIANVSGAAGDVFVTLKFAKMPTDILVKDTGVSMTVYSGTEG